MFFFFWGGGGGGQNHLHWLTSSCMYYRYVILNYSDEVQLFNFKVRTTRTFFGDVFTVTAETSRRGGGSVLVMRNGFHVIFFNIRFYWVRY